MCEEEKGEEGQQEEEEAAGSPYHCPRRKSDGLGDGIVEMCI